MAPKYKQFADQLERDIDRGIYAVGDQLPSERVLAQQHHLAHMTVNKALFSLVNKGRLARRGRNGTVVLAPSTETRGNPNDFGVIMLDATPSHHNPWLNVLPSALQARSLLPVIIDVSHQDETTLQQLDHLHGARVVIVDAQSDFPYGVLKEMDPATRLVFISRPDENVDHPFATVIPDYCEGARLAMHALAAFGRLKVLAPIYGAHRGERSRLLHAGLDLAEKEIAGLQILRLHPDGRRPDDLEKMLSPLVAGGYRPDGIFGSNDFTTIQAMKSFQALGLRVPEDVAAVGYWNTPWADSYELTSVSPNPEEVVAAAMEMALGERNGELLIAPRLVVRQSCPTKGLNIP